MEVKTRYRLHEAQKRVFDDNERFVVLVAGRRFGKTILAIVKILSEAVLKTKQRIWYIAPTYKQAKLIAWRMLLDLLEPEWILKKNEVELEVTLLNNTEISLKGAENEDSLRGVGLDYVVLDEYASMKSNVWNEIIRPMLTDTKGRALFIGTPQGKNSLYELWQKGQEHKDNFSSYLYHTIDNPAIDESEVLLAKNSMPEIVYRQEYEASFEEYHGLCYPMFNPKEHIIKPFDLKPYWKIYRSIDYGYRNPFCCLWLTIDDDGIIYVIDEHYEALQGIKHHTDRIKQRNYQIETSYIDPSCFSHNREKNGMPYSIAMELMDEGVLAYSASRSERNVGIAKVGEMLQQGKIKIFENCYNLIREFPEYRWKDTMNDDENSPEQPVKKNDHALDSLRYFCITREKASELPEAKQFFTQRGKKSLVDSDKVLEEIFEEELV